MKRITMLVAALALVAMFGCKNHNQNQAASNDNYSSSSSSTAVSSSNSSTSLSPEQLGELGAKIKKHPGEAQKLLSDQGLTEQSFEQQVRKVAEDPAASKRYAQAYKHPKA